MSLTNNQSEEVMKYLTGFIAGSLVMCGLQSSAGIVSHVAAYEYGKHVARQELKHSASPCDKKQP
jgi:hypothetical protein